MVCYLCGHMLGSVLCHAGLASWASASCRFMGPSRQGGYWLGFIALLINVSLVIFFSFAHVLELKSDQITEVGRGNALWNLASKQVSPTIVSELNSQPCATLLLVPLIYRSLKLSAFCLTCI